MKLLIVIASLLAACVADPPQPCTSPAHLTGHFSLTTQNEKLGLFAKYLHDTPGQKVRFMEMVTYENKSLTIDVLLHFREGVIYEINKSARTCKKSPLRSTFQPLAIPRNATLLGKPVLGTASGIARGLLVSTWIGDQPGNAGKYITTFTEFGCIPINTSYQTKEFGWMGMNFFNNDIGISDPSQLNPPDYCTTETSGEEPQDYASLLSKQL